MLTCDVKSMTKPQLIAMLETKEEGRRQYQALVESQLAERDAKIMALEAQVKALAAKTGRPVAREEAASVKELPVLAVPEGQRRVACPINAEHGLVMPNVKGRCPLCFTERMKANAMANYAARTVNQPTAA